MRLPTPDCRISTLHGFLVAGEQVAQARAPCKAGADAFLKPIEESSLRAVAGGDAVALGPAGAALPRPHCMPVTQAKVLPEVQAQREAVEPARQLLLHARELRIIADRELRAVEPA